MSFLARMIHSRTATYMMQCSVGNILHWNADGVDVRGDNVEGDSGSDFVDNRVGHGTSTGSRQHVFNGFNGAPTKLLLQAAGALVIGVGLAVPKCAVANDRPNVLIILADDLGFSDLACYGGEIPTPAIDELAANGLRYSAFYSSARCCPSRASLMTGLHPHQTGIGSFESARPDPLRGPAYLGHLNGKCVTLAEVLRASGYTTWMVGKWHLGSPGPIERGFGEFYGYVDDHSHDQWNPANYQRLPEGTQEELSYGDGAFYATDVFNDYALEFLRKARRQPDKPWLLYVAHSSPHFPIQAPKESIEPHVERYLQGWDVLRKNRMERIKELGIVAQDAELPPRSLVPVDEPAVANGYGGKPNPAWDELPETRQLDLARRMATYAAMVEHIDRGVARLLADLREHGELENTLIMFLSDNGACYEWGPFGFDGASRAGKTELHRGEALEEIGQPGTHHSYGSGWANLCNTPLKMYKHFCHEGGIAVPLILHWPRGVAQPGTWVHDPAHLMDLLPTICQVTGATYPTMYNRQPILPVEGESLAPTFVGKSVPERTLAFEHQGARALRKGRWKIVWGKRQATPPEWELYDLTADRAEQHDLANHKPDLVERLAAEWIAWARRVKVYPFFEQRPLSSQTKPAYGVVDGSATLRVPETTEPLFDFWMRDTYVMRGPDDYYYLTGTTAAPHRSVDEKGPHCWDWNDGIYLWRSGDLKEWEPLGCVWSLDNDASWQSEFNTHEVQVHNTGYRMDAKHRAVWAPEIHYVRSLNNWFIVACMSDTAPQKGSFILRSKSGKPTGPYENIAGNAEGPIYPNIDGSLFEDDDGSVWFIGHNHFFAPMESDMSDLAAPPRRFTEQAYPREPYIEGAFVFKHDNKYHLVQAVWSFRYPDGTLRYGVPKPGSEAVRWSYDCVIATSDRLQGPYGRRYTAGVGMGHNNIFRSKSGAWYATMFGNPRGDAGFRQAFLCRPAIVRMEWKDGRLRPQGDQGAGGEDKLTADGHKQSTPQ